MGILYVENFGDLQLVVNKLDRNNGYRWQITQDRQEGRPLILAYSIWANMTFGDAYNEAYEALLRHIDNYLLWGAIIT